MKDEDMTEASEEEEKKFWSVGNIFMLLLASPIIIAAAWQHIIIAFFLCAVPTVIAYLSVKGLLWFGVDGGIVWFLFFFTIFLFLVFRGFQTFGKWATLIRLSFLLFFLLDAALFYPPFADVILPDVIKDDDSKITIFMWVLDSKASIVTWVVGIILGVFMLMRWADTHNKKDKAAQDEQDEAAQDKQDEAAQD